MMKGKTYQQIQGIFNIPSELADEEDRIKHLEIIRDENEWCDDG